MSFILTDFCWLLFTGIANLTLPMDYKEEIFPGFYFSQWRILWISGVIPVFIAFIFLFFMPEAPKYYLSVGKQEEALKVLEWMSKLNKGKTLSELGVTSIHQIDDGQIDRSKKLVLNITVSLPNSK